MKNKILFILCITVVISACQKTTNNSSTDTFADDRSSLLENVTNNIIIPAHENLKTNIDDLKLKAENFTNSPTSNNLSSLRNAWMHAYMSWQYVEMFAAGKAGEIDFPKSMNTYPCSGDRINSRIAGQPYDLNQGGPNSHEAQGFPALDYMLYGLDLDSNMVLDFYIGTDGDKYLAYLNAVINQMSNNTNLVLDDWKATKDNFISLNGNNATAGLNILTNDFIYYYEKGLRSYKIGIPCGKIGPTTRPPYEKGVEAYYRKDISKQLALTALNACKDFFMGKSVNSPTVGFSYNDFLVEHGESALSADIINALDEANIAINALEENFRLQIAQDNVVMRDAYDEVHDVVSLLKVKMLAVLNFEPDYSDTDGD